MVAAAAMSLPRHVPASWGTASGASGITISSLR
jgi:hypothetical protein